MAETAPFSLEKFKQTILRKGGLGKGVFFDCTITNPSRVAFYLNEDSFLLCKAANMPPAQLDTAEVKYFTRSVRIPASRQFSPVTLTFYNTQNYLVRNQFLTWLSRFNTPVSNLRGAEDIERGSDSVVGNTNSDPTNNYATIELRSRNENHDLLGTYRFYSAFPSSVAGLQYSYENDQQFQTYDVEFQYLTSTYTPEAYMDSLGPT